MFGRLKLGKAFGIDVYLHWTFFLLIAWISLSAVTGGGGLIEVATTLALVAGVFGCVVLHELGHALAARRYGVGTHNITLYPIGGVANLTRMPRDPKQELVIALAGPAVNVVIAAILAAILYATGGFAAASFNLLGNSLLLNLLLVNIIMIVFNMLPSFPMDGGRVLRAVLAMNMPYLKATRIAAAVGKTFAFGFGLYGLLNGAFMLVLVALFVYFAASQELRMVELAARPYPHPTFAQARWGMNQGRQDDDSMGTGAAASPSRPGQPIIPEIVFHPSDRMPAS